MSEKSAIALDDSEWVGVSGARPERAEAIARDMLAKGATALVSFGLAGALDPRLTPGDLLLPAEVSDEEGVHWSTDGVLLGQLGPVEGRLLGVDRIIASTDEKASLFAQNGAAAIDMESHRVAKVAAETATPFAVIRAIADPAHRALPPVAHTAIASDGSVDLPKTLMGMMRRPQDLPALIRLGRESGRGIETLRHAAQHLTR